MTDPYFIWRGEDSRAHGIAVESLPPVVRAARRRRRVALPGRADPLTSALDEEWACTLLEFGVRILPGWGAGEALAWLQGRGELVLSVEPDRALEAEVSGSCPLEALPGGGWRGRVGFLCQPLKRLFPPESPLRMIAAPGAVSGTLTLYNPGDVTARPVIRVTGSGTVTLSTTRGSMEIEIPDGATGFVLDTDAGVITDSALTINLGEYVSFEDDGLAAFWLPKGSTTLTWDGTVTALTVTPRWRWL